MTFSCVLIGDETLLVQCAEILRSRGHEIAAIVTQSDAIRAFAREAGLPAHGWTDDLPARLASMRFDWLFSAANLRIVSPDILAQPRCGAVNFHDGPLPRYAGLNAPAWALMAGEKRHGVAWHVMTAGVDEGGILARQDFDVADHDTALMLNTRCLEAGIATFSELVERIETDRATPVPQEAEPRSYFGRAARPPLAGTLRFDRPAAELDRLVRGLDFGPGYRNPLVTPKVALPGGPVAVSALEILPDAGLPFGAMPGMVINAEGPILTVAATDAATRLTLAAVPKTSPLPGSVLPSFGTAEADALDAAVARAAISEPSARRRLAAARDLDVLGVKPGSPGDAATVRTIDLVRPASLSTDTMIGAFAALLLRKTRGESTAISWSDVASRALAARFPGYFTSSQPLIVSAGETTPTHEFLAAVAAERSALLRDGPALADLDVREPGLSVPQLTAAVVEDASDGSDIPAGAAFALLLDPDGRARLAFDPARLSAADAEDMVVRLDRVARALAGNCPDQLVDLSLMSAEETHRLLHEANATERSLPSEPCLHRLVEAQVDRVPDAVALADAARSLTYAELDAAANRVAHGLLALGVGPGVSVGLHLTRSVSLVIGALAILKAGGAYVPLDPMFPADRVAMMVEDSGAPVVVTERALAGAIVAPSVRFAAIEDLLADSRPDARPDVAVGADDLAYVIYTSGSTGRPKGVMIEHGNVANFFVGMDERVPAVMADGTQPVWLAVTSLSFDISVLELFWTLARGFKVVIHSSEVREGAASRGAPAKNALDFGLFFWGDDDGIGPAKYRLLIEGARFADANGFSAVWTPERHFHAFGGPYPNPAVTGAAVAAVTKNLAVRAGSCVLPLHHPIRVAEEWAVLDNISNGRVGVAFASGWMPEDFVLRPENAPPHNKPALFDGIDTVRRLWRGESVAFPFAQGRSASVVTQPRPVQKELPVWVTTAGNPETWVEAARLGANVLTHLLGQSLAEVGEKIALYRRTLAASGRNPDDFTVTLMLHTLIGGDRDAVRAEAREPMKAYLKSAAALIKQYAWAFPAFKKPAGLGSAAEIDLQSLDAEEMDAILEFAFLRYFEDSGLFGTVEDAKARARAAKAIGVDEIGCLIDFGVPTELALERLAPLAEVVAAFRGSAVDEAPVRRSLAEDIRAHGVTHIQATPSMMRMFLMDEEDRRALGRLRHIFVGGEAFPAALLADLRAATGATIESMYGPTETTIWSATTRADVTEGVVPLGTPIANTQLYVLDDALRLLPPGTPGELCIGGLGVARGYHGRPELTAERFVANPFAPGRLYRTGDLVARGLDGSLQFLGRTDHQVKLRGYRIELGEIEARIEALPGILQAVVVAREDQPGDVRLVAYVRSAAGPADEAAVRGTLGETLPYYMVPAHVVTLDAFPLTPNAKVDRKALPKPGARRPAPAEARAPAVSPTAAEPVSGVPDAEMERAVAETFARVLGLERVSPTDSFFALGGHSLLAVQAHRELKAGAAPNMAITDLFRHPTVRTLAAHLSKRGRADDRLSRVADRAAMRRAALGDRRLGLDRVRGTG